jgi:hypothetical protein
MSVILKGQVSCREDLFITANNEMAVEFGVNPCHLFVDLKPIYDTANREQLYLAMGELNRLIKLIGMVKLTTEDTKSKNTSHTISYSNVQEWS